MHFKTSKEDNYTIDGIMDENDIIIAGFIIIMIIIIALHCYLKEKQRYLHEKRIIDDADLEGY